KVVSDRLRLCIPADARFGPGSIESCHTSRSRYPRTGLDVRLAAVVAIAQSETRSRNHHTIPTPVGAFARTPDSRLLTLDSVFLTRVAKLVDLVLCQAAAAVALFLPRIAAHVVAILFPKPRQIVV